VSPHRFEHDHKANLIGEERRKFQPAEGIIERSFVKKGDKVADLGSGNGYITLPLARMADEVFAIDAQEEMLRALKERATPAERERIRTMVSELPSIPLEDGCLDHVFLVNILHELGDKKKMVCEIMRVLKKGGAVTFVDFQKAETKMGPPIHERIPEDEVMNIFKDFQLVERFSFPEFYQFELRRP